jgi:hypothetical protein
MASRLSRIAGHLLVQVTLVAGIGCTLPRPEPANSLGSLPPGWSRIAGGPGTGCAQDSSFAFFARPGSHRKVAIHFQGGGACWNSENCDPQGRGATFHARVDSTDDPSRLAGIFDLSNPQNPIRDYSIVFVPYCTADLALGARTVTYSTPGTTDAPERRFQIRHQGSANAERVLAWVFAHFPDPDLVFVLGESAGAVATPLNASRIARHYPRARVVQLGDAAGGFRAGAVPGLLAHWGATGLLQRDDAFRSIDSAAMTLETLYVVAARTTPRVTFAQVNSAEDAVQLAYLRMLGVRGVRLQPLLAEDLADIRRANPGLRTYTAPGRRHGILEVAEFYTLAVDGIGFRDWVAGLLDGAPTPDVGQALLAGSGP